MAPAADAARPASSTRIDFTQAKLFQGRVRSVSVAGLYAAIFPARRRLDKE